MKTGTSNSRVPLDPSFAYADASEAQLKSLWAGWYPGGSGPTSAMRQICVLIESIAYLRGFDVKSWATDTQPSIEESGNER